MTKQLPANPNITHLKNQAKDLKKGVEAGTAEALERVRTSHPKGEEALKDFTLRDAQLTLAREYGFDGWHVMNSEVGERMVEERDLHRWFGVELNNGMWDKIEAGTVDADSPLVDREELFYSAFASAYHWRQVGNAANWARGEHLISRMGSQVGFFAEAMYHARRCLELCEKNPELVEDWDYAFAHEAIARAAAGAGDLATARAEHAIAAELGASIAGDGDRKVFLIELDRGPWYGLVEAQSEGSASK